jgi:hypothetical protein
MRLGASDNYVTCHRGTCSRKCDSSFSIGLANAVLADPFTERHTWACTFYTWAFLVGGVHGKRKCSTFWSTSTRVLSAALALHSDAHAIYNNATAGDRFASFAQRIVKLLRLFKSMNETECNLLFYPLQSLLCKLKGEMWLFTNWSIVLPPFAQVPYLVAHALWLTLMCVSYPSLGEYSNFGELNYGVRCMSYFYEASQLQILWENKTVAT